MGECTFVRQWETGSHFAQKSPLAESGADFALSFCDLYVKAVVAQVCQPILYLEYESGVHVYFLKEIALYQATSLVVQASFSQPLADEYAIQTRP